MDYPHQSSPQGAGRPTTCLSVDDHDPSDIVTHYFGCTEFRKSENFYNDLSSTEQSAIKTALRRVDYLRRCLQNSHSNEDRSLVPAFSESYALWKTSKANDIQTRACGPSKTLYNPSKRPTEDSSGEADPSSYIPERDLKAYMMSFRNGKGITDMTQHRDTHRPLCSGNFPNQKIPVEDLLDGSESPLRKCHEGTTPIEHHGIVFFLFFYKNKSRHIRLLLRE